MGLDQNGHQTLVKWRGDQTVSQGEGEGAVAVAVADTRRQTQTQTPNARLTQDAGCRMQDGRSAACGQLVN